jgi:F-type H+-transporting ATPase subunit b
MHSIRRWFATLASVVCLLGAPALAWAAEGGGGLINIDKSLIIQAVNFLILLIVLHRLLYKPLLAKMEERTSAIKKSLDEAQAARADAARAQQENAARLQAAYAEAAAIREQALREAREEARKEIESAQAQARKLVADTKAQLEGEVRRARDELRREVSDLAIGVAEKLVRQSLRDDDHRRVVDDAIASVGRR